MNPLISVVIPAYNCQDTLKRAIDSVINQSYDNIEIIVVDDGSTDATPSLCDQIAESDDRIRVIHKKNGRQASARNAGLKVCKGEYVLFLDSDDELQINCCKIVTKQLSVNPDFVLYGFNVYKNNKLLRTPNPGNALYKSDHWEIFREHLKFLMPSPCNKLYKRSYIKYYFDENCVHGEDGIFNYMNFRKGTIVQAIEDCLYNVHLDNENSVNKSFKIGRLRDGIKSAYIKRNCIIHIFGENETQDSCLLEFWDTVLGDIFSCCSFMTKRNALKEINNNIDLILEEDLNSDFNSSRMYLKPLKYFIRNRYVGICYFYCKLIQYLIRVVKLLK